MQNFAFYEFLNTQYKDNACKYKHCNKESIALAYLDMICAEYDGF